MTNTGRRSLDWYRTYGPVHGTAHLGLHIWRSDGRWRILVTDAEGTGVIGDLLYKTEVEALEGVEKVAIKRELAPVTINDPDDKWAMPIYEGPAHQAHRLIPGVYRTTAGHQVLVTGGEATLIPFH